jgi:hypothetical protein
MRLRNSIGSAAALTILFNTAALHANAPPGRYTASNGTVYDTKTKLTWQQTAPSTQYTWGSATSTGTAQNYCATLSLNGAGWRVPTYKELLTLVDLSQPGPGASIDSTFFPGASTNLFWSATPLYGSSGAYAWVVSFGGGTSQTNSVTVPTNIRCVH